MRDRKVRYGEQKLLELIDMEMQNMSNLDYSQIKEKIIIEEEKGVKEVESRRNVVAINIKFALSIVLLITSIVTFCTVCTLNDEILFENNYYLTDILVEELDNYVVNQRGNTFYKRTNLLSIMANDIENIQYAELTMTKKSHNKYYCAYLEKNIINKVNEHYIENNIVDKKIFKQLYQNNLFIGVDMMLLKTYIYFKETNINELFKHIKWIEYQDGSNIKYEVKNYQLIYLTTINKADSVIDLKTNNEFKRKITIFNEINFKVKNNLIFIDNNEYQTQKFLCEFNNIEEDNNINISMKYLECYCAEIVYIKNMFSIYINIPEWYKMSKKYGDIILYERIKADILKIDNILSILNKYKIHEDIYKSFSDFYVERYYYDYNKVKLFLFS